MRLVVDEIAAMPPSPVRIELRRTTWAEMAVHIPTYVSHVPRKAGLVGSLATLAPGIPVEFVGDVPEWHARVVMSDGTSKMVALR